MTLIHVSELPTQRREEARGLVRLGSSGSETGWLHCVEGRAQRPGGMLTAVAVNGVMLGVAGYEVDEAGPAGRTLRVPLFVAFELGGRGATSAALRDELEKLGEKFGCVATVFGMESRGLTC